jgi:type VI secretion system secreted protein VgrG
MALKQDPRIVAIKTALGPDVLAVRSVTVQEQLSRLFQIEAELASENGQVDFDKVVGHDATVRLDVDQKGKRYFNGVVSRLVQVANQGGYAHYRATIVPWLWFLTRTSDCRIFQQKSVPDIIEEVFKGHGFSDYQLKLSGTHEKKEYCVQYRETDFNFVSRLMEYEGIYYFFEHQDGKHVLVMADSTSAHKPFPGYAEVPFHELEKGAAAREAITDWMMEKEAQPIACALNDFDFKKPKTSLRSSSNVTRQYGKAQFEIYDYPGEYVEHAEGDRLADVRINELQSQYETLHGQATARGLATGCTFKLKGHARSEQNREYLITGTSLHADAGEFASTGGGSGGDGFFSCSFTAIDKAQQFRAARLTPKPIVQGPQTAIVSGPKGEEIYTDKYGRVKVQFHWDRYGKEDENSSCWVRVAQSWAGKKWGAMYIPRISQEVVVEFLEGDPDRPLITGSVYNEEQKVPYDLPAEMTKSTLKSNSTKGGVGFNEIRIEDKKDKEQIFIHAERNMDVRVKNSSMERVIGNRHLITGWEKDGSKGGDQREMVYQDKHLKVHRNQVEQIGGNMQLLVGGVDSGEGNQDVVLKGTRKESIEKDNHLHVKGKRNEKVDGDQSLTVGGKQQEKVGTNHALEAGQEIHLKAGMKVIIEAGMQLTIKGPGGFVDIGPAGVTIQGTMVLINSGGAAGSGSGSSPNAPEDPKEAAPTEPAKADDAKSGQKSARS